jgi:hypothetical protein
MAHEYSILLVTALQAGVILVLSEPQVFAYSQSVLIIGRVEDAFVYIQCQYGICKFQSDCFTTNGESTYAQLELYLFINKSSDEFFKNAHLFAVQL